MIRGGTTVAPGLFMRRFAPTLAGISSLTALTILGLVWLDYASTRRELIGLLRDEAVALRQTVAAAARSNRAAGAVAEGQLAARLLDMRIAIQAPVRFQAPPQRHDRRVASATARGQAPASAQT